MIVKLLTEHDLEFLSLYEGCRGSYESTQVKMRYCWKSHALKFNFCKTKTTTVDDKTSMHAKIKYYNFLTFDMDCCLSCDLVGVVGRLTDIVSIVVHRHFRYYQATHSSTIFCLYMFFKFHILQYQ